MRSPRAPEAAFDEGVFGGLNDRQAERVLYQGEIHAHDSAHIEVGVFFFELVISSKSQLLQSFGLAQTISGVISSVLTGRFSGSRSLRMLRARFSLSASALLLARSSGAAVSPEESGLSDS